MNIVRIIMACSFTIGVILNYFSPNEITIGVISLVAIVGYWDFALDK